MDKSTKIAHLKVRLARVKERTGRSGGTEIIEVAVNGNPEELAAYLLRKGVDGLLNQINKKEL